MFDSFLGGRRFLSSADAERCVFFPRRASGVEGSKRGGSIAARTKDTHGPALHVVRKVPLGRLAVREVAKVHADVLAEAEVVAVPVVVRLAHEEAVDLRLRGPIGRAEVPPLRAPVVHET